MSEVERRLKEEIEVARRALPQADAKAGALLSWIAAALAVVVTILAAGGTHRHGGGVTAAILGGWIGAAILTAAVVQLILVVRPQLMGDGPLRGTAGWIRYSVLSADGVLEAVRGDIQDGDGWERKLSWQLSAVAHLAARKHARIRAAVNLVLLGLGVLIGAAGAFALAT